MVLRVRPTASYIKCVLLVGGRGGGLLCWSPMINPINYPKQHIYQKSKEEKLFLLYRVRPLELGDGSK